MQQRTYVRTLETQRPPKPDLTPAELRDAALAARMRAFRDLRLADEFETAARRLERQ